MGSRIKKFILLRVLFATLLLFGPSVFLGGPPIIYYGASTLICLLSFFYVLWYLTKRWIRWLVITQIGSDLILETFLVYYSGGTESVFAIFYVLTILSAALVLGEKQIIYRTTVLSCISFFGSSLAAYHARVPSPMPRDPFYFYYGSLAKIAVFVAVGQLSNYLSATVLDLKNQLKLRERLSFLGEVVSTISHEIRNPLTAVRTAIDVLRDSLVNRLAPEEQKMMSIIDKESERMINTFQRILNYAKQTPPSQKMLLLDSEIDRTLEVIKLKPELQKSSVVVEKDFKKQETQIYADEEQILALLLNLLQNSYQAMTKGGTLRIGAREELRGTTLEIQDSGPGIPHERLKDIFEPFKSLKKGGTGIGLAEVHKIVMLHEGRIDIDSTEGEGTRFRMFFPKP